MFKHPYFEKRRFEDQIGKYVWIVSEKYMKPIEEEWLKVFKDQKSGSPYEIGTSSDAKIVSVSETNIEIGYIINRLTRFHSMKFHIPRRVIKNWVGIYGDFDHKNDYIFVDDEWHDTFWDGHISAFLLVDAIGIKNKMLSDTKNFLRELNTLSALIDELALKYPNLLFISAADNIIVKASFSPRASEPEYNPELLLEVCNDIFAIIKQTLGLDSYGIFTQGFNIYNDKSLFNLGAKSNHLNTRSLGEPYRELFAIETKIRSALKSGVGKPSSAYFSVDFFLSLNLERGKISFDYEKEKESEYIGRSLLDVINAKYKLRTF